MWMGVYVLPGDFYRLIWRGTKIDFVRSEGPRLLSSKSQLSPPCDVKKKQEIQNKLPKYDAIGFVVVLTTR